MYYKNPVKHSVYYNKIISHSIEYLFYTHYNLGIVATIQPFVKRAFNLFNLGVHLMESIRELSKNEIHMVSGGRWLKTILKSTINVLSFYLNHPEKDRKEREIS